MEMAWNFILAQVYEPCTIYMSKMIVPHLLNGSDSRTRGAKNNYKYISTENTAFAQSVGDWNKLDNKTKESSTILLFTNNNIHHSRS